MTTCLVWASKTKAYPEAIAAARKLCSDVRIAVIGKDINKDELKFGGKVYIARVPTDFEVNTYGEILEGLTRETGAKIVLLDGTIKSKILAGFIAGKLKFGVATDIYEIEAGSEKIRIKRLVYAGLAYSTIELPKENIVLSIKPGAFKPEAEGTPEIIEEKEYDATNKVKIVEVKPKSLEGLASLTEAKIVVGAGRGIKKKEDLEMIKELAEILGGAWGVTRPLAADYGWAPMWIGVSGISIKPDLYIAIGISGAHQHISGVRDSKIIVAINNDQNAPIFEHTDYGIIGDLYQVVPELIKKLKEIKK